MRTAGIVAGALITISLFAGHPVASQDSNPVQPPNVEQEMRKLGPSYEHLEHQQPYRDLGQYPALRGETPSAQPPGARPPTIEDYRSAPPPPAPSLPQPSVRPSYDRSSSACPPLSCGPS